jgi:UPF0176 protein
LSDLPFKRLLAQKFVPLHQIGPLRQRLLRLSKAWQIRGTILLTPVGINLVVASSAEKLEFLLAELRAFPGLEDLQGTVSSGHFQPFGRIVVRMQQTMADLDIPAARPPLLSANDQLGHLAFRHQRIISATSPLPGRQPRDEFKRLRVRAEWDGWTLWETLLAAVPHLSADYWQAEASLGRILDERHKVAALEHRVHSGERYLHKFENIVEPDVNGAVKIIFEDEAWVVVNKPAPLPMHAGGRYYRNTLHHILQAAYHPETLYHAHRLDANTTGVVLCARTQFFAGRLQPQFARGQVRKQYLVRVQGFPPEDAFACEDPISARSGRLGSRTIDLETGRSARTEFRVIERASDGTSLLEAHPITGRTNQIRVHLWHLGFPVCGDLAYLQGKVLGEQQTLGCSDPPLCLHAWKISATHPLTGSRIEFTAAPPTWALARAQDHD